MIGGQNARDQMQKRGLAGAGIAAERELLAGFEVEFRHLDDDPSLTVRRDEGFLQGRDREKGHATETQN